MSCAPEDSDGEQVADWARVSALEVGSEGFQEGKYGRNLAAKHSNWEERLIGKQIYQYTLVIMREYGDDANGGMIDSRMWVVGDAKKSWESDVGARG